MKRRLGPVFCLISLLIASCARPEAGASPFEALAEKFAQQAALPDGPVLASSFEILPDAELVYGPSTAGLDIGKYIPEDSLLARYQELVDERPLSGARIIEKVARDYSINPRLLLAVLEYRAGWVSGDDQAQSEFPLINDPDRPGLFRQLSWLANELNRGFYTRRVGGLERFSSLDGVELITSPDANDASVAVQYALGRMLGYHEWLTAVGPLGINAGYLALFGSPPESASDITDSVGQAQPALALPFEDQGGWFFTSGPHSAWGNGAAWAALDFAPDEEGYGCYAAQSWVLASADGLIVRSEDGIVVQDLDGDGYMGTGWTILYMHIAELDRAQVGAYLTAGERIGHPSCEGGPATGTHLHLAWRYNGEWIPADQDTPFILSGWVSDGAGVEYDGTLSRDGIRVEASGFPTDENKVTR